MILVGKTFEFAASHRLYHPGWTEQKNFEVFGKCANANGHGHNYKLEVSVAGSISPETGMVMDVNLLSSIVEEYVFQEVDHKNLDLDVSWLSGTVTTSENLVSAFWSRLEGPILSAQKNAKLYEIKLWETSRIYAVKRSV